MSDLDASRKWVVTDHYFMSDPHHVDQCRVHVPVIELGAVVGTCCGYPKEDHTPIPRESSREDVPALLDEVERLRSALEHIANLEDGYVCDPASAALHAMIEAIEALRPFAALVGNLEGESSVIVSNARGEVVEMSKREWAEATRIVAAYDKGRAGD